MQKETTGTVISVRKQWWLKVNTKAFRTSPLDGAAFPHIVRVAYTVNGVEYTFRKWFGTRDVPPQTGSTVKVSYDESRPSKGKLIQED